MFDLASKILDEGIEIGMSQGLAKGLEQGLAQGILQCIKKLMENSSCTMEEAFAVLSVDIETQELIRDHLNQENNGM